MALGGAIYSIGGTLNLAGCTLSNNAVLGAYSYGGAICTANGLTAMISCQVNSNLCYYNGNPNSRASSWAYGGGICQNGGSLGLTNSVLAANLVAGYNPGDSNGIYGGEIYNAGPDFTCGGAVANLAGNVCLAGCQLAGNSVFGGSGMALENGASGTGEGGALWSAGSLNVTASACTGNNAFTGPGITGIPGAGGAVYNSGTAVFNDCQISSNTASASKVQWSDSYRYQTQNGTAAWGGGIFNAGQFAITNSTIALNTALGGQGDGYNSTPLQGDALGGGVYNASNFVTMNLTIASNSCVSPGSSGETAGNAAGTQILNTNGTVQLHNTLLACGNPNGNYYGPLTDLGHNLNSDASAPFTSGTSTNSLNPLLAPLANYGGPTLCMNLLAGSPAIGTGDTNGATATDQRGYYRYPAGTMDIGAVQFSGDSSPAPFILTQPASQTVTAGGTASFRVIATGSAPLAYQWQQNNTNLPGATNATLLLTNVLLSQSGDWYSVTVTNASGSAPSGYATLTVAGPNLALSHAGTNFALGFTAAPAQTYDLLVSTNLITWTTQQVIGPFGAGSNFTLPFAMTNGTHFYRLWQP